MADARRCEPCHAETVEGWRHSAHAHASFDNPWYRQAVDDFREEVGLPESRFCAGCHDPLLLVTGEMDREVRPEQRNAYAGVGCVVCHRIERATLEGSGSYVLDARPAPLPTPDDPASVAAHARAFRRPALAEVALCASCHRGSLGPEMGNPHHLAGIDDVGPWLASGYSGSRARRLDTPVTARDCRGCHMPEAPAEDDPRRGRRERGLAPLPGRAHGDGRGARRRPARGPRARCCARPPRWISRPFGRRAGGRWRTWWCATWAWATASPAASGTRRTSGSSSALVDAEGPRDAGGREPARRGRRPGRRAAAGVGGGRGGPPAAAAPRAGLPARWWPTAPSRRATPASSATPSPRPKRAARGRWWRGCGTGATSWNSPRPLAPPSAASAAGPSSRAAARAPAGSSRSPSWPRRAARWAPRSKKIRARSSPTRWASAASSRSASRRRCRRSRAGLRAEGSARLFAFQRARVLGRQGRLEDALGWNRAGRARRPAPGAGSPPRRQLRGGLALGGGGRRPTGARRRRRPAIPPCSPRSRRREAAPGRTGRALDAALRGLALSPRDEGLLRSRALALRALLDPRDPRGGGGAAGVPSPPRAGRALPPALPLRARGGGLRAGPAARPDDRAEPALRARPYACWRQCRTDRRTASA